MHPIVNIAVTAARQAGKIILRAQDQLASLHVVEKGPNDFVSQVDKTAESIIIEVIKKSYPQHAILGEESGFLEGSSDATWIIDPLDGTTNFLHGFPHFCISIAFKYQDKLQHGVVYDPIRDELFTASRGDGARMNDKRLRVNPIEKLELGVIGTGFPFRDFSYLEEYVAFLKALMPRCAGIRRAGSAALDLAYVAAGRLDGFWEFGLKPWDIAAGALFIQEAGGFISTIEDNQDILNGKSILAGSPKVFHEMMELCKRYFKSL